ncbi:MAG: lysophospholipid acyltransferase family protein [Pyrinomonadaceae bacterium]|nr:lysophospholipid acyltransferase family protein [Pyrinomonadaceae bacterium]
MLEAKKSAWFQRLFLIYNRHLLKRRFHSLNISGLDFLRKKNNKLPLLLYANHSSWWDGLIIWELLRKFEFENYVMMEEKQLRKLYLFRKLGAFSVVRENPREAIKSINYAARLLSENARRSVLIFPQGEILPNDIRPIRFYNGLARIIQKVEQCSVVPIALRFEFTGNFKPEIYIKIGEPSVFETTQIFKTKIITEQLTGRLTETLDELKRDLNSKKFDGYESIF